MTDLTPGHPGWHGSLEGEPINDTPTPEPSPGTEKVYEVIKFVSTALAIDALEGLAVHCVAGPDDPDLFGILHRRESRNPDVFLVSIHDVLTDEFICATDIRNFVEVIVP